MFTDALPVKLVSTNDSVTRP